MNESHLAERIRSHVTDDEPPFRLDVATVTARGIRLRRRRTAAVGAGSLLAAAALAGTATLVVPTLAGPRDRNADPATSVGVPEGYDAATMPQVLDQKAREVFSRSVDSLGPSTFAAHDSQDQPIPPRYYDKASDMTVTFGPKGHSYRLAVSHREGEAEGVGRDCATDLSSGNVFVCEVTRSPAGDIVLTTIQAKRPLELGSDIPSSIWGGLTRGEIESGQAGPMNPAGEGPIDPDQIYFDHNVEVVHDGQTLTVATETVRARSLADAEAAWVVPLSDLEELASDPLAIPAPPLGEGGCPWTLPGTGVTCGPLPSGTLAELGGQS